MQEMDLRLLVGVLMSRIKWIIASIAIGVVLFAMYAFLFVPEEYTSSALLYVRNMATDTQANSATASNLSASEYLANNYAQVMKTEKVVNHALAQLNGQVSAAQMRGMVSSSLIPDTALLKVSASYEDAEIARLACDAMAKSLSEMFPTVTGEVSSAKVVEDASNAVKTAPNVVRSALLGALVGLVLSVVVILLREFLDNTIRDKETLQIQFNVPVLGEIPSFTQVGKGDKRHA